MDVYIHEGKACVIRHREQEKTPQEIRCNYLVDERIKARIAPDVRLIPLVQIQFIINHAQPPVSFLVI